MRREADQPSAQQSRGKRGCPAFHNRHRLFGESASGEREQDEAVLCRQALLMFRERDISPKSKLWQLRAR